MIDFKDFNTDWLHHRDTEISERELAALNQHMWKKQCYLLCLESVQGAMFV